MNLLFQNKVVKTAVISVAVVFHVDVVLGLKGVGTAIMVLTTMTLRTAMNIASITWKLTRIPWSVNVHHGRTANVAQVMVCSTFLFRCFVN